jgi:hypothetical protein
MNKIYTIVLAFFTFILFNNAYYEINGKHTTTELKHSLSPFAYYNFKQLRDTLYTDKDHFIEVNLATQHGILYSRDGSECYFPVSSGNKWVEKGMETNQGLFVIQWKAKKQHSVQFDSTIMLNWMGFNNGIGFHALEGKSYYRYLGKKNVSHGCIRLSREDAQIIYDKIERGTPVLVHIGNSVLKIAFTKEGEDYQHYSYSEIYKMLPSRFQSIYDGDYFISSNEKILIDEKNVAHSGLPIGNAELIPTKQNIKPATLWIDSSKPEIEKLIDIVSGRNKEPLTYNPFLDSRN